MSVTSKDIMGIAVSAGIGAAVAHIAPSGAATPAERALHGALLMGGLSALLQGSTENKTMLTVGGVGLIGFVIWRAFFKNPEPVVQVPLPSAQEEVTSGLGRHRLGAGHNGMGYMNYGSYAHAYMR